MESAYIPNGQQKNTDSEVMSLSESRSLTNRTRGITFKNWDIADCARGIHKFLGITDPPHPSLIVNIEDKGVSVRTGRTVTIPYCSCTILYWI